jgi:LysM repeat protein
MPLLIMGAGFLVVIVLILVGMFIPRSRNDNADTDLLQSLNGQFRQMEVRLRKLEGLDKSLSALDKQTTEFAISIMDRVDKLEASVSLLAAQTVKDRTNVHRAAVESKETRPVTGPAAGDAKKAPSTRYHRVRAGETLYRISRNYGLTVEELLRINRLNPGAVIYTGQNLAVGAKE